MPNELSPRFLNQEQAAAYLGGSKTWFYRHKEDLEKRGFPKPSMPCDQFGSERWDKKLIDNWMDMMSGISETLHAPNIESLIGERIDNHFN